MIVDGIAPLVRIIIVGSCASADVNGASAPVIEGVGRIIDLAGVGVIGIGALIVALLAARDTRHEPPLPDLYRTFRQRLGRVILLGLELLVAADIIRTVAVTPTLESVAALGVIVLVRTFLSFSLEVELEGRWPWQRSRGQGS